MIPAYRYPTASKSLLTGAERGDFGYLYVRFVQGLGMTSPGTR